MSGKKVSFVIPEPPKDASPQLRQMLLSMKEALEVRLGRRGDPLEVAVTKRDLVDSGLARQGARPGDALVPAVDPPPVEARIVPPLPVAFQAEGVFGGITLTWDAPSTLYSVHGYAEIWRSETADPAQRVLLDSSRGNIYFDRIPAGGAGTYYYWIRFVSEYDRYGPFSTVKVGTKLADADEILAKLTGPDGTTLPFVTEGAVTYMNVAYILDASITSAKIGSVTIGKVKDANGNPVTTVGGLIRADMLETTVLRAVDGVISGSIKSSATAGNGQPRWMLTHNGGMVLNGSGNGGRMEIRDNVIKVFDSNGVLRVHIGDLSA